MYFKKLVGKKCYLSPIDINDAGKFIQRSKLFYN